MQKIILSLILIFLFMGSLLPMLSANTGLTYFQPVLFMFIIFSLYKYPNIIFDKTFILFSIYASSIFLIYIFSGIEIDFTEIVSSLLVTILLPLLLINLICRNRETYVIKIIVLLSISIIIIRCFTAIEVELLFPGIARKIVGMTDNARFDPINFIKMGVATYSFINSLPFLVIPVLFIIRTSKNRIHKIFMPVFLLLCIYTIYIASWGAALIFSIILGSIYLFYESKKKFSIITIAKVTGIFLLILLSRSVALPLIAEMISGNSILSQKLSDIESSINSPTLTGQLAGRNDLYNISIDSFIEHPLLGDLKSKKGGHAYWLDHLANFGLIVTLIVLFLIYQLSNKMLMFLPYEFDKLHKLNTLSYILFGFIKGGGGYEFLMFTLVFGPLLVHLSFKNDAISDQT